MWALNKAGSGLAAIAKYEEVLPLKPEWREKIMRKVDEITQELNYAREIKAAKENYGAKQYAEAIRTEHEQ